MAFDGTMTAAVRCELSSRLTGARLARIAQTESDELLLTFKTAGTSDAGQQRTKSGTVRVQLSVNASLPLVRILDENKPSPEQAPAFCMLLRKKIGNGRLTQISQPLHLSRLKTSLKRFFMVSSSCMKSKDQTVLSR